MLQYLNLGWRFGTNKINLAPTPHPQPQPPLSKGLLYNPLATGYQSIYH